MKEHKRLRDQARNELVLDVIRTYGPAGFESIRRLAMAPHGKPMGTRQLRDTLRQLLGSRRIRVLIDGEVGTRRRYLQSSGTGWRLETKVHPRLVFDSKVVDVTTAPVVLQCLDEQAREDRHLREAGVEYST